MARIIMFPSIRTYNIYTKPVVHQAHAHNITDIEKHKIDHIIIIITVNLSIRIFI